MIFEHPLGRELRRRKRCVPPSLSRQVQLTAILGVEEHYRRHVDELQRGLVAWSGVLRSHVYNELTEQLALAVRLQDAAAPEGDGAHAMTIASKSINDCPVGEEGSQPGIRNLEKGVPVPDDDDRA
jgi:hypothetical protein